MAVENRTTLKAGKNSTFADNASGNISAGDMRGEFEDLIDSVYLAEDFTGDDQLMTAAEKSKLSGIETGATADQTGAEIKSAYEGEANTNAFTDAEQTKLTALPTSAELASTANGEGASLIGVEDAGTHWATTDVEAILDEVGTRFDDLGSMADEDTTNYLSKSQAEVTIALTGGSTSFARPTVPSSSVVIWLQLQPGEVPTNKGVNDIVVTAQDGVLVADSQAATAYTLALSNVGQPVDMTSASANTVTIPADATVDFPIGTTMSINQIGTGPTSVTVPSGTTLNGVDGGTAVISAQWAGVGVRKLAADQWIVQGGAGAVS